jgi:hypothetical protein
MIIRNIYLSTLIVIALILLLTIRTYDANGQLVQNRIDQNSLNRSAVNQTLKNQTIAVASQQHDKGTITISGNTLSSLISSLNQAIKAIDNGDIDIAKQKLTNINNILNETKSPDKAGHLPPESTIH